MSRIARVSVAILPAFVVAFLFATGVHAAGIENPLSSDFDTIPKFVSGALKVMVMVAIPVISLFMVYSGFLFVFAQGNQEQLSKAKTNFLYVIIGSILILGAWVIASLLGNTITELTR